jgi:hypothetical protein
VKQKECVNELRSKRDENALQADELLEMVDRPHGGDTADSSSRVFSNIITSTVSMEEVLKSDFVQEEDLDLKPKVLNQQTDRQ